MSKFEIDFCELAFLAEACIPPVPIARFSFWQDLTRVYWEKMTEEERAHLFEWMQRNWRYKDSLHHKDVAVFNARFDPDNQYIVETFNNGEHRAFKLNDRYYKTLNISFSEEHIASVKKLETKTNEATKRTH